MPDVKTIYNAGLRGYQSALIEAEAKYRQAQLDDDAASATEAAMTINNLQVQMQNWNRMAAEVQRQQPAAPANKYGLSDDEIEIAHGIGKYARGPDGRLLTNEQREELYTQKQQLYHQKLADGSYSRQAGFGKSR